MEGVEVPDSVLVPEEARGFTPPRNIVLQGEGKKIERFIFHSQALEAIEQRALSELEAAIAAKGVENYAFPPHWSQDDMMRCIYGTKWKAENARKVVIAHLKWLTTVPSDYRLLYPSIARVLNHGALYVHGRDCFYRPMLVLNFTRFDLTHFTIDEFVNATIFLLEYIKTNMFLPGIVENWVSVADLGHQGLSSLPISSFKSVVHVLQENYRCRLGISYVFNSPRTISFIWGMIKPFLDKQTVKKVSFHRDSTAAQLFTHFNQGQVERKYGGSAPDLTHFWPPTVPPGPFRITR